jgi:triosephosphate isomerase
MTNKYMYFIANWKMYGNLSSLNTLNKVIKFSKSKEINKGRLIYCPPYTLISSFSKKFKNCQIDIGGQNCHESESYGPYTGSVNSRMLKNIGAHFVIIGHSENREQGESDKLINLKIKSALKAKLKVVFCIGETLTEKKKKKTQ